MVDHGKYQPAKDKIIVPKGHGQGHTIPFKIVGPATISEIGGARHF